MSRFKRNRHEVPNLNTAALPDLVFTVLFFFMIVTHMRDTDVKVSVQLPDATMIEKTVRKSSIVNMYVGKPLAGISRSGSDDDFCIQINDRIVDIQSIASAIKDERDMMSQDDAEMLTVKLHADRTTPMHIVNSIKNELKKSNVKNVFYTSKEDNR